MKKINLLLFYLFYSITARADVVGSDMPLDKPSSTFGGGLGLIWAKIADLKIVTQITSTAWILAVAMIITVMATGVFSHHENIMKSVLKILVTLLAVGILMYWGTNAG